MTTYYHITNYKNLENINKHGLIPQCGVRAQSICDSRCAVFLSKGIINSIIMYDTFLFYFNYYTENGAKSIKYCQEIIEEYREQSKISPLSKEDLAEMEANIKLIDQIKKMNEYKDFKEYLGEGVYLSITDIKNVNCYDEKDCYTTEIIPPEEIKVVVLKNKENGEIVDYRENILTYFMSINPLEEYIDNIYNIITIHGLKDLYKERSSDMAYYNSDNFELLEIPINLYLEKNFLSEETPKKM